MHRKTLKTGASGVTSLTSPQLFGLLLSIIGMHSFEWLCPLFACISLAYLQFVDNFSTVSLKTGASEFLVTFIWHYSQWCNRTRSLCIYRISGILMWGINKIAYLLARLKQTTLLRWQINAPVFAVFVGIAFIHVQSFQYAKKQDNGILYQWRKSLCIYC